MNAATAIAIIEQAIEDEIWDSEVPEDEDEAISDAEEIITQAKDAIADGTESEDIDRVIAIFEAAEKPKRKLGAKAAPAAKAKPAAKKAPAKKPGRPAKKAPEPEPDEDENELAGIEPWSGYDDDKPAEIVESIGVLAESLDDEDESESAAETLQHISIYEPANKNRVKIIDALADIVGEVADAEDAAAADDDDDDDEVAEPIDGYEDLTIKEIKSTIEDYLADADYEIEEKVALLDGTIAFEGSLRKPRKTLINYLNGLKDGLEEEDGEEDEDADDAPAEKPAARGKGRSAKTGTTAGGRSSSAGKSAGVNGDEAEADELTGGYSIKFKVGRSTTVVETEFGPNSAAGYVLDILNGGATSVTVDAL